MMDELRNPGFDDRFTCPHCLDDFHEETDVCLSCGARIRCFVEQQPVSVCELLAEPSE